MITLDDVRKWDEHDELKEYKQEFFLKDATIYMDGNSLGLLSRRSEAALHQSLDDWREHGIEGWTQAAEPWYYMSEKLGQMTAPLLGASPDQVINTGSITTNLHQLLATFYTPEKGRTKIIGDELNFPSDIYAVKSQMALHHLDRDEHFVPIESSDGYTLKEEDIIAHMKDDVALLLLPSVLYRSGQLLDMRTLTKEAHKHGILVLFDLAHSIGAVPHQLDEWEVDFAVWCTYKYLNSGPGGTGGLYVNRRHLGTHPGLAGWFSSDKEKQFDMNHELTPSSNAGAFQIGTPHILSSAPLLGSLEMFLEAGIGNIRKKSLQLTQLFMDLIHQELEDFGFNIRNPLENERRGGHVCLVHEEAARICKALKSEGVVPDYRSPNVIRLAPVAFYTSYEDVYEVVRILKEIVQEEKHKSFKNERDIIA
ncbi:kynureninase [Halobacillus litoralis]|uniref:Kynureninase n=1 Tax=Halobacillus litoralis TaxID=45668 RepID=A0A845DRU4_9BACI|nr:kynureninase [Halobacillus litoralis]MYL20341.1 kynureninase [Halobacillus litoralis]